MIRRISLLLLLASNAYAESLVFKEQTSHVPYEVISSNLNFRIIHTFRTLFATTDQVKGVMLVDLADLNQGVRIDLSVDTTNIRTLEPRTNTRMNKILSAAEHPKIQFSSAKTFVGEGQTPEIFPFTFNGTLTIANNSASQSLVSDCRMEGVALVCAVRTLFQPTRYGVPLPSIVGLVTEDKVDISGSITFRAQR